MEMTMKLLLIMTLCIGTILYCAERDPFWKDSPEHRLITQLTFTTHMNLGRKIPEFDIKGAEKYGQHDWVQIAIEHNQKIEEHKRNLQQQLHEKQPK